MTVYLASHTFCSCSIDCDEMGCVSDLLNTVTISKTPRNAMSRSHSAPLSVQTGDGEIN